MPTTSEPQRVAKASDVREQRDLGLSAAGVRLVQRAEGDGDVRTFSGHAAVFDTRTEIGDPLRWGWYEQISRSAFDKTLEDGDARFLVDHSTQLLVARKSAGDLRLATDEVGLAVEADLDTELTYVRDLVRNLEKRRITGMSFGFYVVRDVWATESVTVEVKGKPTDIEVLVRTIEEVKLLEVSAVTFPAYEDTDAAVRKMADSVLEARGVSREPITRPAPSEDTRAGDQPVEQDPAPEPAQATTRGKFVDLSRRAESLAALYRLPR